MSTALKPDRENREYIARQVQGRSVSITFVPSCGDRTDRAKINRMRGETERVRNDSDLMESIRRSRKDRKRGAEGTSLEDARREILGGNG
jgi:hypothetical protein